MGSRTLDVLVVDDDESHAARAADRLREAPGAVAPTVETDPETALGRLTDGSFDCLVCACSMDGLDGLDLAALVRDLDRDLPVVVVSGAGSEAAAAEAVRAGAADYLRKGVDDDPAALLDSVRTAVEREAGDDGLDDFVRMARHDLRNPLSVAKGWFQTYQESGDESHYRRAVEAIERTESIIDDFESLTCGDGDGAVERSPVDVAAVATAAWEIVDPADAQLKVDYDVRVDADPSMLQTVLENLFENAVTHGTSVDDDADDAPPGAPSARSTSSGGAGRPSADGRGAPDADDDPAVTVAVRALDDDSGFYVADDGPGVPPAERQQVFVRGYTGAESTGMGLAIVGSIADAHGWELALVESESGGARFEFRDVPIVESGPE